MESSEVEKFIEEHRHLKLSEVALLLGKNKQLPKEYILNQINGWQKSAQKLPEWHNTKGIHYPDNIALEQCSSEKTAKYKASLMKGKNLADLSGGLGVDAYYFSQSYETVHYVEPNKERFLTAKNNFNTLSANNIQCHHCTAESFLHKNLKFDCIYLDPDRRGNTKKRAVSIEDCTPNFLDLQDEIFSKTEKVMLKFSPMLDISLALSSLRFVKEVHVVAVNNECKELIFIGDRNDSEQVEIKTLNFLRNQVQKFDFNFFEENNIETDYGAVQQFIYEPNAAILKAGAFKSIAKQYGIMKLATNSHLYTSQTQIQNFPGKIFKLVSIESSRSIKGMKANVISRNFPMRAESIQKKYKIKNGGDIYILATSTYNNEKIFIKALRM